MTIPITVIPKHYSPWTQALPSFVQNVVLQKVAHKFEAAESEKDRKAKEAEGISSLQQQGYVESEAHIPDVEYGGRGFMAPQVYMKYEQVPGGGVQPVLYQKKYGKEGEQPVKMGTAIKGTEQWTEPYSATVGGKKILLRKNKTTNKVEVVAGDRATKGGKSDYAPDVENWRNPSTGEMMPVNVRDNTAIAMAEKAGFSPVGPRSRGYLQEEGKGGAEYASELAKSAAKARGNIVTLDAMDQLLDRITTGKLAKPLKSIQQWADAFGLPVDTQNLSAKEAFLALTEQLALQSRNQGEGMVLAGQMSDRDVRFLRDMNPQLIISKGGNKLIINIRKKIANRQAEIAKLAKTYRDSNRGVLDQLGFDQFVRDKLSDTSIYGIPKGATTAGTDKVTGLPVYELNGRFYIPEF